MKKDENSPGFDAKKYMNKYISEKIIYKRVNFTRGKPEDEAMLEWIDQQPEGTAPYIRRLIKKDMNEREA